MSINKKELVKRVAGKINKDEKIVEQIMSATLEEIYTALKKPRKC